MPFNLSSALNTDWRFLFCSSLCWCPSNSCSKLFHFSQALNPQRRKSKEGNRTISKKYNSWKCIWNRIWNCIVKKEIDPVKAMRHIQVKLLDSKEKNVSKRTKLLIKERKPDCCQTLTTNHYASRKWNSIVNILKKRKDEPKILYPVWFSDRKATNKCFHMWEFREYCPHNSLLILEDELLTTKTCRNIINLKPDGIDH